MDKAAICIYANMVPYSHIMTVASVSTMPGERAQRAFRKCLNSADEMVCIAAVNAIMAGKLAGYVEDLKRLNMNSKSGAVRRKVNQVLSELGKDESATE